MDYRKVILVAMLCFSPIGRIGVGEAQAVPPLDDAYYWPGAEDSYVAFPPADSEAQPVADTTAVERKSAPVITYTNVQDTTVTVVIKR